MHLHARETFEFFKKQIQNCLSAIPQCTRLQQAYLKICLEHPFFFLHKQNKLYLITHLYFSVKVSESLVALNSDCPTVTCDPCSAPVGKLVCNWISKFRTTKSDQEIQPCQVKFISFFVIYYHNFYEILYLRLAFGLTSLVFDRVETYIT